MGIFAGLAIWFLRQNLDALEALRQLDLVTLSAVFLLSAGGLYLNGLALEVLAHPYGVRHIRYFWLSCAVSFLNLITPFRGGLALRAWYLRKYYRLPYAAFATGFFGNYVLVFLISSVIGLFLFGLVFWQPNIRTFATVAVFGLIACGCLLLLVRHDYRLKSQNRFALGWNKVAAGWEALLSAKQTLIALTVITIAGTVFQSIILYLLFQSTAHPISSFEALAITVFSVLGIFFSITPGALGVAEGFAVLSAIVLGIPADVTLVIALAKRAVEIVLLFILGPIGKTILFQGSKK